MILASTSGWARRLAACLATATLAGTAIAGPVVIRATGPSAAAYPAGRKLADNAQLSLKAGDTLVLLDARGTRTISGPGTFAALSTGMRAGTAETAARILANTGTSERRGGAVRGGVTPTVEVRSPNLWLVDLSKSGTVCVADANAVRVWRGTSDKAADVQVGGAGASGTITLPAGAAIGSWPRSVPIADGAEYTVAVNGAAPVKIKVMVVSVPESIEDTASELIAKGCRTQLDLLVATTQAGRDAG